MANSLDRSSDPTTNVMAWNGRTPLCIAYLHNNDRNYFKKYLGSYFMLKRGIVDLVLYTHNKPNTIGEYDHAYVCVCERSGLVYSYLIPFNPESGRHFVDDNFFCALGSSDITWKDALAEAAARAADVGYINMVHG